MEARPTDALAVGGGLAVVALGMFVVRDSAVPDVEWERPGTSIGVEAGSRRDVSAAGESSASGHAILATALVVVGRVHHPLDVLCAAGLGIALGAAIDLAFGRR